MNQKNSLDENPLFEKYIEMKFPLLIPKDESPITSQPELSQFCSEYSNKLASFIFMHDFREHYSEFLTIITEILRIPLSSLSFPYQTFSSKQIPYLLIIFIKTFPGTELFFQSFRFVEILSKNEISANQFCQKKFIPLILEYIKQTASSDVQAKDVDFLMLLLRILNNIFCKTSNAMMDYSQELVDILLHLFTTSGIEPIQELCLLVLSNLLQYPQYVQAQKLVDIISALQMFMNDPAVNLISHVLFIFHQIAEKKIELVPLFINPSSLPILVQLTSHECLNIRVSSLLIFISILKIQRGNDELKLLIYQNIDFPWFANTWTAYQDETHGSLSELLYYLIANNCALIKPMIESNIFKLLLDSLKSSTYSIQLIIVRNLIRLFLLNDFDFVVFSLENGLLDKIDSFMALKSVEISPFFIHFYFHLFHLAEIGTIEIKNYDYETLHEQMANLDLSNCVCLKPKRDAILQKIESLEENAE